MRLNQFLKKSWVGIVIFALTAPAVHAESTVGLIPADKLGFPNSSVLNLLEVELTNDPEIKLVERARVEAIFEEQTLQLALGAKAGKERRDIGNLLKADVLVLLEPSEAQDERQLRVVIFRTRDGIRLSDSSHAWDDANPESLAENLMAAIGDAIEKGGQEDVAVVAVSPFQSQDLLHTYDQLQSTYASLVENILSSHPKILPVEIEEAQNLSEELSISGGESIARSSLPYFVRGTYRNEGKGEDRRLNLTMELALGGKTLYSSSAESLPPDEIPQYLEESARQISMTISESGVLKFDPLREAQEMAARGESFRRMGEYEKALSFYESALLVKPELKVYHREAMGLCKVLVHEYLEGSKRTKDSIASGQIGIGYAMRMFDHLEQYMRSIYPGNVQRIFTEISNEMDNPVQRFQGSYDFADPPLEVQEMVNDYVERKQEIFVSFVEEVHSRGWMLPDIASSLLSDLNSFSGFVHSPNGNPKYYDYQLRLLAVAADHPSELFRVVRAIRGVRQKNDRTPEEEKFLSEIEASPYENIRFAWDLVDSLDAPDDRQGLLEELKNLRERINSIPGGTPNIPQELDRKIAKVESLETSSQTTNLKPEPTPEVVVERNERGMRLASIFTFQKETPEVTFKPIRDLGPNPFWGNNFDEWKYGISQWVKLDNGMDLVSTWHALYALDQNGDLDEIYRLSSTERFRTFLITNDYIWIGVISSKPRVLALNPKTMKFIVFDSEEGLPPTTETVSLFALSRGEVLAVGYFDRTWIGKLNVTEQGEKHFELLHEARNTHGPPDEVETAFRPGNIWRFESEDRPGEELIAIHRALSRSPGDNTERSSPLAFVLNLSTGEATLEKVPAPESESPPSALGLGEIFESEEYRRARASRDFKKEQEVRERLFQKRREFQLQKEIDGRRYAFGWEAVWLMGDQAKGEEPKRLNGQIPSSPNISGVRNVFLSNRFGVVYQIDRNLYQVQFNLKDDRP
ncbi:MAG: hypothetical protein KC978_01460 [Candidatus Omnitrophica bacterium]|nr:hypothetical protein [Candidatus Omnitrophota bacterium]